MRVEFDKIQDRFRALWEMEILDRCCISVTYTEPMEEEKILQIPKDERSREEYWTNPEVVLKRELFKMDHTYFAGDAFPLVSLNLGPAGHAGFAKDIQWTYEPSTIWFHPIMEEEMDPEKIIFDPQSFLFQKTLEHARYFSKESKDRYVVSMPDLSGNIDVLSAFRGAQNLLMDFLTEDPEKIHQCCEKIQLMWEVGLKEVYEIVRDVNGQGSSIGWLHTWASGLHGQMQCDTSVMFSNTIYEEYAKNELEAQSSFLEYPLYHFDGVEQIRHLDTLLGVEKLKMIQWTNVVGQPSPLNYLEEMKKIQKAGKALLLCLKPEEVPKAMEELSSRGLMILTEANSKEEADALVKTAEKLTRE